MKIMKSMIRLVVACGAIIAAFALEAATYNKVEYSNSTTIVPGKWFSKFSSVLNYANTNNVPMVVFWGNEGCGHCKHTEEKLGTSADFKAWMEESGIVFAYVINDLNLSGSAAQNAKLYAKSGSEYPFIGVYWKSNTQGQRVGGKMSTSAKTYPGHFCGRDMSAAAIKKKILSYIPDWSPEKGGEFNFTESEGNRYEAEAGTASVTVSLTRRSAAAKDAYDNTVEVILPDGSTTNTTLSWKAGEASKDYVVPMPDLSDLKDGDIITIRMDGNDKNTLKVHFVGAEVSAANPLGPGERTVGEWSAKKGMLNASAAEPLEPGEWTMDFDVATQTVARATGKAYTLVAVQGSLWCHDCANTERNFLSITNAAGENMVQKWAKDNSVALVTIDVPNYSTDDPDGTDSPCLLTRTAVKTTLAWEVPQFPYYFYDLSQGGAPQSLATATERSGLGYLTRKGISDEAAAEQLALFRNLVTRNTDEGGFHRPEDTNPARTGIPIFVLLRKDGTVAARLTQFAAVSPYKYDKNGNLIATETRTANILKRFDEMLAIADAAEGDADFSEIENNFPSDGAIPAEVDGDAANGQISHVDFRDAFRLDGVTGAARLRLSVTNENDAAKATVTLFVKDPATGKIVQYGQPSEAKALKDGIEVEADIKSVGTTYALVKAADITDAAFDVYSAKVANVHPFTLAATFEAALPQEAKATAKANAEGKVKVELESGAKYKFEGLKSVPVGVFDTTNDIYTSKTNGVVALEVEDGELTYQKWVPGTVGFGGKDLSVKENSAAVTVSFGRSGGTSGDVTVRVFIDRDATDYFYDLWDDTETYKQIPRFSIDGAWDFLPADLEKTFETNITYREGQDLATCTNTYTIGFDLTPAELKKYFGDGKIVLGLEVVAGGATLGKSSFTINVAETSTQKPGTVFVKGADPFFAKPYTVYAKASSSVDVTLGRATALEGIVRTKFSAKGGSPTYLGDAETFDDGYQYWANHDDADKTVTVTNLPAAGKTLTLTLAPVSPLKIRSKGTATVKIVSVADDATEFEEAEFAFTNLIRYTACSLACPFTDDYAGARYAITPKKLSGSIPSGLSAKVIGGALVFAGAPTKTGTFTAVYQLVDNRGTKKSPKNVGGMPVKVTFRVVDPAKAASSEDPAVQAIANPAIAATRTLSDLMVWGRDENEIGRLAGKLTVTIPPTGKVSAKYACSAGTISFGATSWNAKTVGEEEADGTYEATLQPTKKAYTNYTLAVTALADGKVMATVTDPAYPDVELTALSNGRVWTAGNAKKKIAAHTAAAWKGRYTVTILPAGATVWVGPESSATNALCGEKEEAIPGIAPTGAGYLALTMTAATDINAGRMRWAGKLANGTALSGSTILTEGTPDFPGDEETAGDYAYLPIFTRVTTKLTKSISTLDQFATILKIEKDGASCLRAIMPAETLVRGEWRHTVTKPAGRDDFDFRMDVFAFGSYYTAAKRLSACCEESYVEKQQQMNVGGLDWIGLGSPAAVDPVAITVKDGKTAAKDTIAVNAKSGAANPRKLTLKLNRTTGVVTGTFALPYTTASGAAKTVTATWQGVILSGWGCPCGGCWDLPEELDLESIFLPFICGGYTFSDAVTGESGAMTVRRGGTMGSSAAAE